MTTFMQPPELWYGLDGEVTLLEEIQAQGEQIRKVMQAENDRKGVDEHKDYLRRRRMAEQEDLAERQEADLSGELDAAGKSYYELAIKGHIKPASDTPPARRIPIIQGVLEQNTVNWLAAGSGTFKSFVAGDIAFRYGQEEMDYHGLRMTHGRALIVLAEGATGYSYRERAWRQEHDREVKNVDYLPHAVQLGRPHEVAALAHAMRLEAEAGNPYTLVIIDTQAMSTIGLDENSGEMNGVIAQLGRLKDVNGACILVVHHFGKDKRAGMRGSSMLYAAADTIIVTKREKGELILKLSTSPTDNGKQKDLEAKEDFLTFRMEKHEVDRDYFDDPITSLVPVAIDTPQADPTVAPEGEPITLPGGDLMDYLRGMSYFSDKGTSATGLATHLNESLGREDFYQQLTRNKLVALAKEPHLMVEQPQPKGYWYITPRGNAAIMQDAAERVRLEQSWVDRPGRSHRGRGATEDQITVSEAVSEPPGNEDPDVSETPGNVSGNGD